MIFITPVRFPEKRRIETLFIFALLVSRDKNDRPALRIEGERSAPHLCSRVRVVPQLLHVGVLRVVERSNQRPPRRRPRLLQRVGGGNQRQALFRIHRREFGVPELVGEDDLPTGRGRRSARRKG